MGLNSMDLSDTNIGELEAYMEEIAIEIANTEVALFILEEDDDDYDDDSRALQIFLEELGAAYDELDLIWELKCETSGRLEGDIF